MPSRLLVIISLLFILSIFFKSGYSKLYEGDEISILKNGAIVRSRYKVEPLEDEGAIVAPLLELATLSLGRMLGSVA